MVYVGPGAQLPRHPHIHVVAEFVEFPLSGGSGNDALAQAAVGHSSVSSDGLQSLTVTGVGLRGRRHWRNQT